MNKIISSCVYSFIFEPDLSLEDHNSAAEEFADDVREDVVIRFPDLNIVIMHMGWPFFDNALYMMGIYPSVYMETSVAIGLLGPDHRMLKDAVATAGSDSILFGTLQMGWPEVIGRSVSMIRDADYLTLQDKHAILWENAVRLLGVKEAMTESMPPGFIEWADKHKSFENQ